MDNSFTRRGVLASLIVTPVAVTLRDEFGVKPKLKPKPAADDNEEKLRFVLLDKHGSEIGPPEFAPNGFCDVLFRQNPNYREPIHYWAVDLYPQAQSLLGNRYYKQELPRMGHCLCDGDVSLHFDGSAIEYILND